MKSWKEKRVAAVNKNEKSKEFKLFCGVMEAR